MFSVEGYVGIDLEDLRYLMSLKGEEFLELSFLAFGIEEKRKVIFIKDN